METVEILKKALNLTSSRICIFDTLSKQIIFANDSYKRAIPETSPANHNDALNGLCIASNGTVTVCEEYSVFVQEEDRFGLFDSIPQLVWINAADGTAFHFNKHWVDYTGLSVRDSVENSGWHAVVHPEDLVIMLAHRNERLRKQQEYEVQTRIRASDGSYKWFLCRVRPCFNPKTKALTHWCGTATDIQHSKDIEESLRRAQAETLEKNEIFEASFNALPATVLIARPCGEIFFVNEAHKKMWKMPTEKLCCDISSYTNYTAYHPDGRKYENEDWPLTRTLLTQQKVVEEVTNVEFGDGSRAILKLSTSPVFAADGTMIYVLASVTDVTKQVALEEERLEIMGRERVAVESSRIKSAFLANVSHELRTPLHGIMGMADMILDVGNLPELAFKKASIIKDCGNVLLTIINDILDLSKIEAGKLELKQSPFHLDSVVCCVEAILATCAYEKCVSLIVELDSEMSSLALVGDATKIQQILLNLVGNAIKFTQAGGSVILSVSVRRSLKEEDTFDVAISVKDSGIGMSPETLAKLYKPFMQADASNSRTFCGTGLGLSICKFLVDIMGGSIEANSQVGGGSEFRVSLQMKSAHVLQPVDMAKSLANDNATVLDRVHALIVDDNKINQELARRSLEKCGVELISCADNGADALSMLKQNDFDVVLMDCQMPVMDGFETTRAMRLYEKEHGRGRIPIIAVTASALRSDMELCYESGMDDHIAKPFTREHLRSVVHKWTANR